MHGTRMLPTAGALRRVGRRLVAAALLVAAVACGKSPTRTTQPATASDDFERADGPLGPNWQGQGGSLTIESGEVSVVQLGASAGVTWIANAFGADQFSELVVGTMNGGTVSQFRGLQTVVRLQPGSAIRYGFHYFSGAGGYEIKYDGVSPGVVLASLPASPPVTGDVLRVEVQGTTIRGYLNGQLLLQTTHSQLTGGSPGFVVGIDQGAQFLPRRAVASWRGGDL